MKAILVLAVITSLMPVLCAVDTSKPFDLTTTLGEKFKNCHITKVTPESITIVHDRGVAKLSFTLLGQEWKEQFEYDPLRAREYALAEDAKREAAEAKRAELAQRQKVSEEQQLADLANEERKRLEADAKSVKEYQDSMKVANTPLTPLAPLPGDPTPALGTPQFQPQPIMQTEVVVPTVTPVGDPYSPSKIRSQTYTYPGGYYGGFPYGYYPYQPVYGNPGFSGYTPCPSSSIIPGVKGVISSGGMSIHIGR
jgi:hypothetical protein